MTEPEDAILTDATTPGVPDKGQGKDDYVPLTRAQAESLQRERDESRASERAWADIARNGGRQPQQTQPPANELPDVSEFAEESDPESGLDGDTPEKFVDDFASMGSKALHARGFVTKAEALQMARQEAIRVSQELIGRNNQRTSTDQQILNEFADLKDKDSALFKETAIRYRRAVDMDPNAAKTPAALYLAAEGARDHLAAKSGGRREQPADDFEHEEDRRRRADSQDSRSRGRSTATDDADLMGPEAQQIAKSFGLSDAEFLASQKASGYTRSRGARR